MRLAETTARLFEPDGPLARTLPGFEPRPGQCEMAAAVAETLEAGGILLAEAGTGTGKTLAYLAPAILGRQRVLISTGTKNLQEQIFFKDLPLLRQALGIPFAAVCMKGRGNYLCLHRFESFRRDPMSRALAPQRELSVLSAWAAVTGTGDRAEVEDLPEDLPYWGDIAATADDCLGSMCPRLQDCFLTRLRQRAGEADVLIVNHHLLCADASVRQSTYGEVIPECASAILDEAHQLEDVATQYFGITVSTYRLETLARDGERLIGTGLVADHDGAVRTTLLRLRDRARVLFGALGHVPRGSGESPRAGAEDRIRVTSDSLADAFPAGQQLIDALTEVEATLALAANAAGEALAISRRAAGIRDQLRFLLRASDPDYVYFLECRGAGVFLKASPIDVSAIFRDALLGRWRSAVLTSATLTVSGSFDYVRSRLGIRQARQLCLQSEFDFSRQAILYLPSSMPDPRTEGFAAAVGREVIEILRRSAGRAFVLFTSYAVLRAVQPVLASALDYPMLVQGDAPRSVLLGQFRTRPHAVLLATSSFWQGVDVVGEALSCVIVDKLPFASPGDPVTAARIGAIAARGGDPFSEYQLPLAILLLLQGLGRLIRHRQDRGVMAVLDPRLRTRAYGALVLQALPPAPITTDLDEVGRFLDAPTVEGLPID